MSDAILETIRSEGWQELERKGLDKLFNCLMRFQLVKDWQEFLKVQAEYNARKEFLRIPIEYGGKPDERFIESALR